MGKQPADVSPEAQGLYERLGAEIAGVRADRKLTQRQLGDLIGESQTTVSDYEKGTSRVPLYVIVVIEDELGLPRGSLLRRSGYVADPVNVVEAVQQDTTLTQRYRDEVVSYYEYVRERSTQDAR